jgi:hypothetical protein
VNALGDIIVSTKEHECVLCHRAVLIGDAVQAAAYDALTWPRVPDALVWLHPECSALHTAVAKRAPLYTTGWYVIARPQACSSCLELMTAQSRAWRIIDYQQLAYALTCSGCHSLRLSPLGALT